MRSILLLLLISNLAQSQTQDSIVCPNGVLYYYTYGAGTPLIILSGGPGIASHQEDDLAQKLSEKYQTILFDQRGTGKSWTKPFDSTTINVKTAVEDLEMLRKHLKLPKLNLSGHSWGAMLATAYTAKYPKRVNALILIGGGELDFEMTEVVNGNIDVCFQLSDTTAWYYWNDPVNIAKDSATASNEIRKINWSLLSYDRSKLDAIMKQASRGSFNKKMNTLMWQSLRNTKFKDFSRIPKSYKGKTLILFGWQDPIALTTLSSYQKRFPKALVKGINQCGHMPSVEQPVLFYEILFDFLKFLNH
jgi:proline iminopeptidase